MVSATMMISGGALNPAVTLGLLVARRLTLMEAIVYWIAEIIGGILGGFFAIWSLQGIPLSTTAATVPAMAAGVSTPLQTGVLVEAVLTFFLVFVVFGTGVDRRYGARTGGILIGFTIIMDIIAGGPITGASMNPARWLGSAVATGLYGNAAVSAVTNIGIYIIGPLIGGTVAGLLWGYFLLDEREPAAAEA
jgi:glycerol uptake facilitator-like aquaporin